MLTKISNRALDTRNPRELKCVTMTAVCYRHAPSAPTSSAASVLVRRRFRALRMAGGVSTGASPRPTCKAHRRLSFTSVLELMEAYLLFNHYF